MRNLFPILLITFLAGFYACNRNAKADPTTAKPSEVVNPDKEAIRKASGMSSTSSLSSPEVNAALKEIKHNPVPQAPLTRQDSAKLYKMDDFVKNVESERGKAYERKNLALQVFSPNDNMFYTTYENKIMEVVLVAQNGEDRERHYYYFKDGAYAFYRHLEMKLAADPRFGQETIVFFNEDDQNEIFEVQRRRLDLKAGENPNKLLNVKFDRPDVDKKAIRQEVDIAWAKIFKAIELSEMGVTQ